MVIHGKRPKDLIPPFKLSTSNFLLKDGTGNIFGEMINSSLGMLGHPHLRRECLGSFGVEQPELDLL